MKTWLFTILSVVLLSSSVFARDNRRSILEVKLSDGAPLVVSIDNRDYNKYGAMITIGDLPRGWHDLRVYEYLEYKKGGGRAKLLYSGRVRTRPGVLTTCIVSARNGSMTVYNEDILIDNPPPVYNDRPTHGGSGIVFNNEDMKDLKGRVEARITDTDKMELLKSVLSSRTFYSVQVRTMLGWLAFESTRLDFAKWSYTRVLDKQDYWKLEDVFTFSSSKEEFSKHIRQ